MMTKPVRWQRGHKWQLKLGASEHSRSISICFVKHLYHQHLLNNPQNASVPELNKPLTCLRGHKIYRILYWPNPSHASENTKCISTYIEQTPPLPARKQNVPHPKMSAMTHNTYLNMCWPNAYHAIEDSKWFWTYVDLDGMGGVRWTHFEIDFVFSLAKEMFGNTGCDAYCILASVGVFGNTCWDAVCVLTGMGGLGQHMFRSILSPR